MHPILTELNFLLRAAGRWALALLALASVFLLFGPTRITVFGSSILVPVLSPTSFAALAFQKLKGTLVPEGVTLIVADPVASFAALVHVAFSMAALVVLPLFLFALARYLSPALYAGERRAFYAALFSSLPLFALGVLFSFAVLIPSVFSFLYGFTPSLGAEPFLSVPVFVGTVFGIASATGLAFLLPVAMTALSSLGVVEASLWPRLWREAVLTLLILSAIMTPDGSGVGMIALAAPLAGLYGLGVLASSYAKARSGALSVNAK